MAQLVRKKPEPIWIDNKWKLWYKIGEGSFGEIFRCKDKEGLSEVAVKLESRDQSHPQLIIEKRVLDSIKNSIGFPNVHYLGPEGDYIAMIMDLLGPSLEDMFNFCNRTFSYQTVLLLGDQMLDRVQFLHNHDYLHRDLKPDNFLTGVGPKMIDFGLAKRYRELPNYKHLVYKTAKSLTGTARYASMNTHEGIEQSRRDDIEALAYCLIYFYRGLLPWQGINGKTKAEKYEVIYRGKKDTPVEDLCGKNGMLMKFLSYSRNLQFDEEPNYAYLRKLIRDEFKKHNFVNPTFDWNLMALMKSLRRSNDLIVEHKNMIKNKKIKVEDPLFVNEIELNEEVLNKDKKPIIISRTPKLLSKSMISEHMMPPPIKTSVLKKSPLPIKDTTNESQQQPQKSAQKCTSKIVPNNYAPNESFLNIKKEVKDRNKSYSNKNVINVQPTTYYQRIPCELFKEESNYLPQSTKSYTDPKYPRTPGNFRKGSYIQEKLPVSSQNRKRGIVKDDIHLKYTKEIKREQQCSSGFQKVLLPAPIVLPAPPPPPMLAETLTYKDGEDKKVLVKSTKYIHY